MLNRLKRQFILIVMALVGLVLTGVLGLSLFSIWQSQESLIDEALQQALDGSIDSVPTVGILGNDPNRATSYNMLTAVVEVNGSGFEVTSSKFSHAVSSEVLTSVVHAAISSEYDDGYEGAYHVSWLRRETPTGYRISMVDTSAADKTIYTIALRYLELGLGSLLVLAAISWGLANWSLRPVIAAWDQQKRFIADVSHELKTPLAVISANIQILNNDTSLSADAHRWLKTTVEETNQMKSLVNDLLQLARADEAKGKGATEPNKEHFDFSEIVRVACLEFDVIAFEKLVLIDTDIENDIEIDANKDQVKRLVRILIDNACKYAEKNTHIMVSLHKSGKKIHLAVNNKGNVISPEDLPHLFDRFYRSDKARTHDGGTGGFGLGLAIAKSVVEIHGGSISASSTEEEGTTFNVYL